jgi:neurofibromin 1
MRERLQAAVALEIALSVSLCSANKDICDEVTNCIGMICKELRLVDADDEGGEIILLTMASNIKIYEELSSDNSRFIGRKAQQKRIRKYLRMIPQHTPGNMAAWEEAWKRWKQLTLLMNRLSDDFPDDASIETNNSSNGTASTSSTIGATSNNSSVNGVSNSSSKKMPLSRSGDKIRATNTSSTLINVNKTQQNQDLYEEKAIEWQNYTGFLAALGGCCLADFNSMLPSGNWESDQSRRASSASEHSAMVERFISDMTDMLVSDNVYIREGVKDTLGNDLSPALYVILFNNLQAYMNRCFDSNGDTIRSPQNKLFVEQAVLVLRLIIDRLVNPGDCLLNIDFSTLINQVIDYLNGLPNTYITLRIKIKMCLLIESVMQKKEHIVIRDEIRLRNKLLEISVEWTSDFALVC